MDSEDRTVRGEGFWRLQVPEEGYFRKSLSLPSQITPSIPENKLQIQHFLLFMPSCEHFVMAADLSFWARILLKLRRKGANIHKKQLPTAQHFLEFSLQPFKVNISFLTTVQTGKLRGDSEREVVLISLELLAPCL